MNYNNILTVFYMVFCVISLKTLFPLRRSTEIISLNMDINSPLRVALLPIKPRLDKLTKKKQDHISHKKKNKIIKCLCSIVLFV